MNLIKKHKILSGAIIALALISLIYYIRLTPLGGDSNAVKVIEKYFDNLAYSKYSDAYELLSSSSQKRNSKEDFSDRYKNIFGAIGLTSITCSDIEKSGETETTAVYKVHYTYESGVAGEIQNDVQITLTKESGAWRIVYKPNLIFQDMGENDTVSVSTLKADRGDILTSDKMVLATNVKGYSFYVNPSEIEDKEAAATAIAKVINVKQSSILKKIQTDSTYLQIKILTPSQATTADAKAAEKIKGVYIEKSSTLVRDYPQGELMAHIIGYVGSISSEEYKNLKDKGYLETDIIGKAGLEQTYEDALRGTNGKIISIIGDNGKTKQVIYKKDAVKGQDVWLTINSNLQKRAHDLLKTNLEGKKLKGSVIVLNPKTGAVLTMESYPTYDNNIFLGSITTEKWKELTNSSALFSIATQALYPPGSTVKPFVADAALKKGTINANTVFTGTIKNNKWIPNRSDWVYPAITRVRTPATVNNLSNALIHSDNIYFAWVAMKMDLQDLLNEFELMGFSKEFNFDVPVATSRIKNKKTEINIKIQADMGYGQGELLVTPIQLASVFGAFANNGTEMQPHLLSQIKQYDGLDYKVVSTTENQVLQEGVVSKNGLSILTPMLRKVVTEGTCIRANLPSITILGKTGTAQISKTREIGWFAAYYESGDRLVLVTIDGDPDKVPVKSAIAREMLKP